MVECNFSQGKKGKIPEENLPKLRFVLQKTTWSERYANSGPQRWEESV